MKWLKLCFVTTVLLIGLAGCVTDKAYRIYVPAGTYPAKALDEVLILSTKPDRDYVVLADLQARGGADKKFRKIAAQLGADAVIVSRLGGFANGVTWAGDTGGGSYSRMVGIVIKYK